MTPPPETPPAGAGTPAPTVPAQRTPDTTRRLRGIALDAAPVLAFTAVFAPTGDLVPAVSAALALGAAAVVLRAVRRRPVWGPLAGLAVTALGVVSVIGSGDAAAFFLPKIAVQVALVAGGVLLSLVGLPPAGLAVSLLARQRPTWRRCRTQRRAYQGASLVLLVSPLVTSAASLPLYRDGDVVGLGVVDLLRPLVFALAVLAAWRVHARLVAGHRCPVTAGA